MCPRCIGWSLRLLSLSNETPMVVQDCGQGVNHEHVLFVGKLWLRIDIINTRFLLRTRWTATYWWLCENKFCSYDSFWAVSQETSARKSWQIPLAFLKKKIEYGQRPSLKLLLISVIHAGNQSCLHFVYVMLGSSCLLVVSQSFASFCLVETRDFMTSWVFNRTESQWYMKWEQMRHESHLHKQKCWVRTFTYGSMLYCKCLPWRA